MESDFVERPAKSSSLVRRKPLYAVGVNDAQYVVLPIIAGKTIMCPFYRAWSNMLQRCYCLNFKKRHSTYTTCSVIQEWHLFSTFKKWMKSQDWESNHLDKDILFSGNKVYGPDTCIFVSQEVNKLLLNNEGARGQWPLGIHFDKQRGKFVAQCSVEGNHVSLGRFKTLEEAERVYKTFKSKHIISVANEPKNHLVKQALIKHAEELVK